VIPAGWFMRGLITDTKSQRRGNRDGYVDVQFDKLVSPDGQYEVPFNAKFSTKDKKLQSVAKIVGTDAKYMAIGGVSGAVPSVQLTGLPVAVSTHGISVGIGAAAGATIGLIGATKKKGSVATLRGGDQLKLTTVDPIMLPGFDQTLIPSSKPIPHLEGLDL